MAMFIKASLNRPITQRMFISFGLRDRRHVNAFHRLLTKVPMEILLLLWLYPIMRNESLKTNYIKRQTSTITLYSW